MKTTCPKCGNGFDVPDAEVMSAAARISSKRREKHGGPTPAQAKAAGAKGARKRWGEPKP
jgi:hypothetical protein